MGKIGRAPAAHKTTPDSATSLSRNIPELFRTQPADPASGSQALTTLGRSSPPSCSAPDGRSSAQDPADQMLRLSDLQSVATDIKLSFTTAISELRGDLQEMADRIHRVERAGTRRDAALRSVQQVTRTHNHHLLEMHRKLEDLDNRGRRHNIRIRGLPETVEQDRLLMSLLVLFNELLDRPPETPIDFDRFHRALRPRSSPSDPPRDVICCITSFSLKEEILRRARSRDPLIFEGTQIQLFQDLSPMTLQHRRSLQPLLRLLRSRGILYRWRFPFGLSASRSGRTVLLQVPADLQDFCTFLQIPQPDLPEWYGSFLLPEEWPHEHSASDDPARPVGPSQRSPDRHPEDRSSLRNGAACAPAVPSTSSRIP